MSTSRALAATLALLWVTACSSGGDDTTAPDGTGATDAEDGATADPAVDPAPDAPADGSGGADAPDDAAADADGSAGGDVVADGSGPPDVEAEDVEPPPDPLTASWCYRDALDPERPGPDYDQFSPTIGAHCLGTDMQDITGVQKVVFFGDSVTVGTPPTQPYDYFRNIVADGLKERFGEELVVESYARFGARVDDLLIPSDEQFRRAFPDVEPLTTLAIFTVGGNDIFAWAEDAAEGQPIEVIEEETTEAITVLGQALAYLDDPVRFPNGIYVIFANVYEYTDATGDTASCPFATAVGLGEPWPEGRGPVVRFNEAYMRLAVEHGFDLVFMLEHFCGHGFHHENPESQCYTPGSELWFDPTCIHPNPAGHREIAQMILSVVDE